MECPTNLGPLNALFSRLLSLCSAMSQEKESTTNGKVKRNNFNAERLVKAFLKNGCEV